MNEVEMIIKLIDDKKGFNIVAINVEEVTPLGKYYVIASCKNERQTRSLADEIEDALFANNFAFHHIEGRNGDGKWMLVDAEDVVVHLFTEDEREKYKLEKLWGDLPHLDVEKIIGE